MRQPRAELLAGYPTPVRRVFAWYDGLSEWQRVRYALIGIVFLLASAGYMLGLGSTVLLRRIEAEDAALAAQRLLTPEPTPSLSAALALVSPEPTAAPTLTPVAVVGPTARTLEPSPTPFSGPQIAEKPAVPRSVPVNPVPVVPRAPVVVAPPTATAKPRNLENATPEPPAASVRTPTAGVGRTPVPPTATRPNPTPAATALPTLRLPPTAAPTAAAPTPVRAAATRTATPVH